MILEFFDEFQSGIGTGRVPEPEKFENETRNPDFKISNPENL